jgi:hypothetical protein
MLVARTLRKVEKRKRVKEVIAASKIAKKANVEAKKQSATAVSALSGNNTAIPGKKQTGIVVKGAAAKVSVMIDEPKESSPKIESGDSDSESDSDSDTSGDSDSEGSSSD